MENTRIQVEHRGSCPRFQSQLGIQRLKIVAVPFGLRFATMVPHSVLEVLSACARLKFGNHVSVSDFDVIRNLISMDTLGYALETISETGWFVIIEISNFLPRA